MLRIQPIPMRYQRLELTIEMLDREDAILSPEQRETLLLRQLENDKAKAERKEHKL